MTQASAPTNAQEVLSVIPTVLGYYPHQEIAVLSVVMTEDGFGYLASSGPLNVQLDELTSVLLDMRTHGASAVITALYSSTSAHGRTVTNSLSTLHSAAAATGLHVLDAWHIGPKHYRNLTDHGHGGPLTDLTNTTALTELIATGAPPITAAPTGPSALDQSALTALIAQFTENQTVQPCLLTEQLEAWRSERFRATEPGTALNAEVAAGLLAALTHPGFRDTVVALWLPGGGIAADHFCKHPTKQVPLHWFRSLLAHIPLSDDARLNGDRTLLTGLAHIAPGHHAAHPLALLALLEWAYGNQEAAEQTCVRAQHADHTNSLARYVQKLLTINTSIPRAARNV